ncbi:hypothetical protein RHGRI_027001 [Rhododendron griersonianum]|uniref:Uncharacterized protein n=1 Tax=Rhododendron griersonianum TaxID=479676 RepID=A0AAV6IUW7_9ERIC|nr:hypothetical protein RHGRI_027001 [Rhododendron griersonianum]
MSKEEKKQEEEGSGGDFDLVAFPLSLSHVLVHGSYLMDCIASPSYDGFAIAFVSGGHELSKSSGNVGAKIACDTQRHGKHVYVTEDNTRARRRSGLSRVRDHPITPQRRQLEGAAYAESSTRSSGSTARSHRSEASGPSLTLGLRRTERPKARTHLDFDMNYPPLKEKRSRSLLQPYGEESLRHHQQTSRDMHRERDDSVVLFD